VVGDQRHTPAAFTSGKGPGTHFMGACVGRRAGLNGGGKSRSLSPHWDSISGWSSS